MRNLLIIAGLSLNTAKDKNSEQITPTTQAWKNSFELAVADIDFLEAEKDAQIHEWKTKEAKLIIDKYFDQEIQKLKKKQIEQAKQSSSVSANKPSSTAAASAKKASTSSIKNKKAKKTSLASVKNKKK